MELQQSLEDIPGIESFLAELKKWVDSVGDERWDHKPDWKAMKPHSQSQAVMQSMAIKLIRHDKIPPTRDKGNILLAKASSKLKIEDAYIIPIYQNGSKSKLGEFELSPKTITRVEKLGVIETEADGDMCFMFFT